MGMATSEPLSLSRDVRVMSSSRAATWAAISLSTYLVAAAVATGLSETEGGYLLFAGSAATIVGRVLAGHVTDRLGARGFGGFALLVAVGAVVFLVLPVASGGWFVVLVLAAFVTGWGWPGLMIYTVVNANARSVAASSAITQAGVFAGAGIGPLVLGLTADRLSFDAVWLIVGLALALSGTVVVLTGRAAARAG